MDDLVLYEKIQADGTHTAMLFKKDFLKECPNFMEVELHELFQKYNVQKFLHCSTGPACWNNTSGYKAYWLNGNLLDPTSEEVKKIEHLGQFNKGFNEFLTTEDKSDKATG